MKLKPDHYKLDENLFASTWKISLKNLRASKQIPRRQLEKIIRTGQEHLNKDYKESIDDRQKPDAEVEKSSTCQNKSTSD